MGLRITTRMSILVLLAVFPMALFASWNNPYPAADEAGNILYSAFRERPKTLDSARAYSSNAYALIAQIYNLPFQHHYLKHPYTLKPLTTIAMPTPIYHDRQGWRLSQNTCSETENLGFGKCEVSPARSSHDEQD